MLRTWKKLFEQLNDRRAEIDCGFAAGDECERARPERGKSFMSGNASRYREVVQLTLVGVSPRRSFPRNTGKMCPEITFHFHFSFRSCLMQCIRRYETLVWETEGR